MKKSTLNVLAAVGIQLIFFSLPLSGWAKHIKDFNGYVGSMECKRCHEANYEGWKTTLHSKMEQDPVWKGPKKTVLGDFSSKDPALTFKPGDVDMLVGSRFKQRYAKKIGDDYYMLPAEWNVSQQKWQVYNPKQDWWVKSYPQEWDKRPASSLCEGCHQTGYDLEKKKASERNIACEACHGPGKEHVEAMNELEAMKKLGKTIKPSDYIRSTKIINPALLDAERANEVCFQCHLSGRSADNKTAWPVGFKPGDVLSKFWIEDAFEKGKESYTFWPNGSAHKNRVQGNTFKFNEMYTSGVKCFTCHSPHGSRYVSFLYKPGNNLCLTCHGPDSPQGLKDMFETIEEHTRHKRTSKGSDCIECHMVKTGKHAVKEESRDHSFKFIFPQMTKEHGVPNACTSCHTDKTVDWAIETLNTWGVKPKE